MNAIRAIRHNLERLGYQSEALIADYSYSDVMLKNPVMRTVALAAFTKPQPSYRTAAFGVVPVEPGREAAAAKEHRALGAPLLMCYSSDRVSVWQVSPTDQPRRVDEAGLDHVDQLFARYTQEWHPDRIHRAKAIGVMDREYQLDFVDLGLLPAIEGQIHLKLDRVLQDVLEVLSGHTAARGPALPDRQQYLFSFRLLAAKILQDRGHDFANSWDSNDVKSVWNGIITYYNLKKLQDTADIKNFDRVNEAWRILKSAINFRNLSADDLAFVYENTLVTSDAREKLGIHSTPRPVAEYVVSNIRFTDLAPKDLYVYEPFSGAAPFLICALRHIRDCLPKDWDAKRCHEYLVEHVWAHEFDEFACDVAMLSLILADYPNQNGWHVEPADLFKGDVLQKNLARASVVLCNPPYEDFLPSERDSYRDYVERQTHKPLAVLDAALNHPLQAVGFVLPEGIIKHKRYGEIRARIEKSFSDIQLVSLPDRVFQHSLIPSALLIAQDRRISSRNSQATKLVSAEVLGRDREEFLSLGQPSEVRTTTRPFHGEAAGHIWVEPLDSVWQRLRGLPVLDDDVEMTRGLEWGYDQSQARRDHLEDGFRSGLATSGGSLRQYSIGATVYLDTREESLRTNALDHPWDAPKILATAIRVSRGRWRFAASVDRAGLVASQQFIGMWLKSGSKWSIEELAAILNSPVANAYLYANDPGKHFRLSTLRQLPLPRRNLGAEFRALYTEYQGHLTHPDLMHMATHEKEMERLLVAMDAEVLAAYNLPPRVERELLEFFRGEKRPVSHPFSGWIPDDFGPAIPLKMYLETDLDQLRGSWMTDVFKPLPDDEAQALQEALE